jgi:hypothetical protein
MTTSSSPTTKESLVKRSPPAQLLLSVSEVCALAGLTERRFVRLLRLGIVEPSRPGSAEFTVETGLRLKRMLRLRRELGVGPIGASIIVDLLERLADLEARLGRSEPASGRG